LCGGNCFSFSISAGSIAVIGLSSGSLSAGAVLRATLPAGSSWARCLIEQPVEYPIKLKVCAEVISLPIPLTGFTQGAQLKRVFLLVKYPRNEMLPQEKLIALTRSYLTSI
jgi:hypothetical protein